MAYVDEVRADSPTAWFRLGESAGTSAADEIGGAAATYTGGFTLGAPSLLNSDANTCVDLNGSTGYVTAADRAAFDLGDTFTLECWVVFDAFRDASGNPCVLIDKGVNAYVLRQSNAMDGTLLLRRNGVANICTSTIRLQTGVRYHVATTKAAATAKLYVNGVDVTGTVTNSTMTNNANAFGIGVADVGAGPNGFLDGRLDEGAVYSAALSGARVLAHYQAGSAPIPRRMPLLGVG